jgi:hypothetical protein
MYRSDDFTRVTEFQMNPVILVQLWQSITKKCQVQMDVTLFELFGYMGKTYYQRYSFLKSFSEKVSNVWN